MIKKTGSRKLNKFNIKIKYINSYIISFHNISKLIRVITKSTYSIFI